MSLIAKGLRGLGHTVELVGPTFDAAAFTLKAKEPFRILNTCNCDSFTDEDYPTLAKAILRFRGPDVATVRSYRPDWAYLSKLYIKKLDGLVPKTRFVPNFSGDYSDVQKGLRTSNIDIEPYAYSILHSGIGPSKSYVIKLPYSSTSQGVFILKKDTPEKFLENVKIAGRWLKANIKKRPFFLIQNFFPQVAELRVYFIRGRLFSIVVTKPVSTGLNIEETAAEKDDDPLVFANGTLLDESGNLNSTVYTEEQAIRLGIIKDAKATRADISTSVSRINERLETMDAFKGLSKWPFARYDFFIGPSIKFNEVEFGSADLNPSSNPGIIDAVVRAIDDELV